MVSHKKEGNLRTSRRSLRTSTSPRNRQPFILLGQAHPEREKSDCNTGLPSLHKICQWSAFRRTRPRETETETDRRRQRHAHPHTSAKEITTTAFNLKINPTGWISFSQHTICATATRRAGTNSQWPDTRHTAAKKRPSRLIHISHGFTFHRGHAKGIASPKASFVFR